MQRSVTWQGLCVGCGNPGGWGSRGLCRGLFCALEDDELPAAPPALNEDNKPIGTLSCLAECPSVENHWLNSMSFNLFGQEAPFIGGRGWYLSILHVPCAILNTLGSATSGQSQFLTASPRPWALGTAWCSGHGSYHIHFYFLLHKARQFSLPIYTLHFMSWAFARVLLLPVVSFPPCPPLVH